MFKWIKKLFICMSKKKEPEVEVVRVIRLTDEVYQQLVKQVPNLNVGSESSVSEVGYKLGVAKTLEVIRQGIVTN